MLVADRRHRPNLNHAAQYVSRTIGTSRLVAQIFHENLFPPVRCLEARVDRYPRNGSTLNQIYRIHFRPPPSKFFFRDTWVTKVANSTLLFHKRGVTSALAPKIERADHGQGGGGGGEDSEKHRKSIVLKILTSNPLGLKILQTVFAEPAPVKAFRRCGEGGTPPSPPLSQNETCSNRVAKLPISTFFRSDIHSLFPSLLRRLSAAKAEESVVNLGLGRTDRE